MKCHIRVLITAQVAILMAKFHSPAFPSEVLLLRNPNASCAVESDVGDRFFKTVAQMRRMSLVPLVAKNGIASRFSRVPRSPRVPMQMQNMGDAKADRSVNLPPWRGDSLVDWQG